MERYLRITNLLVVTIILCTFQYNSVYCNTESTHNAGDVSGSKLGRIQRFLKRINKTPVLTISSPDGDIIDCIDIRKQVAFDHPLLKNHKIQRRPSVRPGKGEIVDGGPEESTDYAKPNGWHGTQVWHQNGTSCPRGTVSVRRTTLNEVLGAPSLDLFGKKQSFIYPDMVSNVPASSNGAHEYAIANYEAQRASSSSPKKLYGTKASINLWKPYVERNTEFSLSQLWLVSGSYDNSNLNTIEAGWQVYPKLYRDANPRLFVFWTRDAYNRTGCYNHLCSGFVQTSRRIAVGATLSLVSSAGKLEEFTLYVYKDPKNGNWWLKFNEILVGYWPAKLFTSLSKSGATTVQWGGEIINQKVNGKHTATDMGSGKFAEEGIGKASYFKDINVVDSNNTLQSAAKLVGNGLMTFAPNPTCYNIKNYTDSASSYHFFYGGPGRNSKCP